MNISVLQNAVSYTHLDVYKRQHLVVALSGAPVADGVRPFFLGDFHNSLGNDGPGEGGAQQIFIFIYGARLDGGIHIIGYELFLQDVYKRQLPYRRPYRRVGNRQDIP